MNGSIRKRARLTLAAALLLSCAVAVGRVAAAADAVTDDNVAQKIVDAKAAGDHEDLAKYFDALAVREHTRAEVHRKMDKSYGSRTLGGKPLPSAHQHCDSLVRMAVSNAKDYEALAKLHRNMAAAAK